MDWSSGMDWPGMDWSSGMNWSGMDASGLDGSCGDDGLGSRWLGNHGLGGGRQGCTGARESRRPGGLPSRVHRALLPGRQPGIRSLW